MRPWTILLIEDDIADVELVRVALDSDSQATNIRLVHAQDGEKALDYLRHADAPGGNGLPGLVLLDLRLPRMSGLEVLESIKTKSEWRSMPVVVFTSSDSKEDSQAATARHANDCVHKPVDLSTFTSTLRRVAEYWRGSWRA